MLYGSPKRIPRIIAAIRDKATRMGSIHRIQAKTISNAAIPQSHLVFSVLCHWQSSSSESSLMYVASSSSSSSNLFGVHTTTFMQIEAKVSNDDWRGGKKELRTKNKSQLSCAGQSITNGQLVFMASHGSRFFSTAALPTGTDDYAEAEQAKPLEK